MSREEFKAAVKIGDLSKAVSIAKMILSRCIVAVIGESGSGVSSFINAIRGLRNSDSSAAKTGIFQTTEEKKCYLFTWNPCIYFWDLPGFSAYFGESQYLDNINISIYDFFIIIASERCRTIHVNLAREIQKRGKPFCFVRSKVDVDLDNECKKKGYSEEKTLDQIRKDCRDRLETAGISYPEVYLISIWHHNKYDLPLLKVYLPGLILRKKRSMLLTISCSVLQEKKREIQGTTWRPGSLGLGLSVAFIFAKMATVAIMADCMRDYCKDFGLHDSSLEAIANQTGKCIRDLTAVMKTPLASNITYDYAKTRLENRLQSELVWWIPAFSAGISFVAIQEVLDAFVADLADDAQSVLTKALEQE